MPAGRPVKYTPKYLAEIEAMMEEYTDTTDIPILKEFCYTNHIPYTEVYAHIELTEAIKRLLDKKESQLERKGLSGDVNVTMAIFSLKQLGWRDKTEQIFKTVDDEGKETGFKLVPGPNASA